MNRYAVMSVLLAGLLLLAACGPAATLPPSATLTPTAKLEPTVALVPEALQEAMFVAAREDDIDAMKRYMAAGADLNDRGELNIPVLRVAAIRGNLEMLNVLFDAGATFDAVDFRQAVLNSKDNVEIVQAFIDRGADVDEAPSAAPAHTPLMNAAEKGYIEVGKLLLAKGADINKTDSFNDTALNVAAFHGQLEFAKMLVEMGAELNVRGWNGRTALGHAVGNGHDDVADFLMGIGATD